MSRDWGLHCKACSSSTGAEKNHGEEVLSDLARMAPLIKRIREMDSQGYLEMNILGGFYGEVDLFVWLSEHAGHEIELYDEYGHHEPLKVTNQTKASGIINYPVGHFAIVGEPGPERVTLPEGSQIFPLINPHEFLYTDERWLQVINIAQKALEDVNNATESDWPAILCGGLEDIIKLCKEQKKEGNSMSNISENLEKKQMLKERVEKDFTYHAPKPGQPERYQQLREKAKELALLIVELTPLSREQSLALTYLEQASMFANAAIARNE